MEWGWGGQSSNWIVHNKRLLSFLCDLSVDIISSAWVSTFALKRCAHAQIAQIKETRDCLHPLTHTHSLLTHHVCDDGHLSCILAERLQHAVNRLRAQPVDALLRHNRYPGCTCGRGRWWRWGRLDDCSFHLFLVDHFHLRPRCMPRS